MTRLTQNPWQRVSRRRPCPVCGKPDWCLFAGPADAPAAAICARVESVKRCGEAGWLHELRHDGPTWAPWRRTISRAVRMMAEPGNGKVDFARLAETYRAAVRPEALERLARELGLSVESLTRLGIGWAAEHHGWSFPMSDRTGKVRGIRLRLPDGRKLAVRGGREGLFVPDGMDTAGRLCITEGPTDTAALLAMGFHAVGRPSCTGGLRLLVEAVMKWQPSEVVILADADAPGQRGAENLARQLVAYVSAVRLIAPPAPFKDARAWKQAGATTAEVLAAIDAASVRRLSLQIVRQEVARGKRK